MLKANRKYLLILLIFTFSFAYRMLLMLWNNYPSGADIGLHNSVIYSITGSGNTNFLWNFYQIGGGLSLTFPGYHIFASGIMMITGAPEYWVHAAIVSLFSSLTVLCAFLITRSVWTESSAYIVAFLVAISRFDIEMLLWGGYPNVITLLLIPLTFYLYLQKDRFSLTPFLVSTSILAGSIFLTHSLSAGIFVGVTFVIVLFMLVSPKTLGVSRKRSVYWLMPVIFGVVLVAPLLMDAVPAYLSANSSFTGTGTQDITLALLSTRVLPLELVLPLFGILAAFFVFSKKYNGRFFALPTVLLAMWLFIPLILTQGYLFGFYIDYNRFLYFIILPAMIFIAILIDHGATFSTRIFHTYQTLTSRIQKTKSTTNRLIERLSKHLTPKTLYAGFVLFFLLFSFVALPIFMTPGLNVGETIQSFYQVMDDPGYQAIQWAKQNTIVGSVFVSDALYGWWFSGFAQRPTLSAVDPQYLSLNREFKPAQFARNLLDTNYLVDNGLVQVREDGGYLARHNPEILATLNWTYFPYSFFNFASNQTQIRYRYEANGSPQSVFLDKLAVKEMRMENDTQYATITIIRGNEYFNYTQLTTVYRGLRFVNLTSTIDSIVSGVSFDWVDIDVQTKGTQIQYNDDSTVALLDEGVKAFGQLIFKTRPYSQTVWTTGATTVKLQYCLEGKAQGGWQISASAYSVSDDPGIYSSEVEKNNLFSGEVAANLKLSQPPEERNFEQIFNYRLEMQTRNVTYIACRYKEIEPKFLRDPSFSLVFINSEVAIFKVNGKLR